MTGAGLAGLGIGRGCPGAACGSHRHSTTSRDSAAIRNTPFIRVTMVTLSLFPMIATSTRPVRWTGRKTADRHARRLAPATNRVAGLAAAPLQIGVQRRPDDAGCGSTAGRSGQGPTPHVDHHQLQHGRCVDARMASAARHPTLRRRDPVQVIASAGGIGSRDFLSCVALSAHGQRLHELVIESASDSAVAPDGPRCRVQLPRSLTPARHPSSR
jgi:hypothetical protein